MFGKLLQQGVLLAFRLKLELSLCLPLSVVFLSLDKTWKKSFILRIPTQWQHLLTTTFKREGWSSSIPEGQWSWSLGLFLALLMHMQMDNLKLTMCWMDAVRYFFIVINFSSTNTKVQAKIYPRSVFSFWMMKINTLLLVMVVTLQESVSKFFLFLWSNICLHKIYTDKRSTSRQKHGKFIHIFFHLLERFF